MYINIKNIVLLAEALKIIDGLIKNKNNIVRVITYVKVKCVITIVEKMEAYQHEILRRHTLVIMCANVFSVLG